MKLLIYNENKEYNIFNEKKLILIRNSQGNKQKLTINGEATSKLLDLESVDDAQNKTLSPKIGPRHMWRLF